MTYDDEYAGEAAYYMAAPLFNISTLQDRNATVAEILYGDLRVTGSSKREPGDRFVSQAGKDLAIARAMRNLARELERRGRKAAGLDS